jgi:hypothetical protein
MPTRMSRIAPVMPSAAQQEAWVALVDKDPQLRHAISKMRFFGKKWRKLTFQQKVQAYRNYLELGVGTMAANQVTRARQQAVRLAEVEQSLRAGRRES